MSPAPWLMALERWGSEWPLTRGWIPLAPERLIGHRPIARTSAGFSFVIWRDGSSGIRAALNQCPHMGVRLETGAVDASGRLRCPLHGWAFGSNGRCMEAPGHIQVPDRGLHVFPTETAYGWVFGHIGPEPSHPLPRFPEARLHSAKPILLQAELPWYLLTANGFDVPHFEHVHGRRHRRPPEVSTPHPDALEVDHEFDIVGRSFPDRLLRWIDGGPVRMRYTVWGGHAVLAEMRFQRITSQLAIFILPDGPCRTLVQMWPLSTSRLDRPLRWWMTREFFEHEIREIRGATLHPASLTPVDQGQETYLSWLATRLLAENRLE